MSHVEPWANPAAPLRILRWLGQPDAPLLFRPRLDWRQWRWGLQFLVECLPWRTRRNMLQILAINAYSGGALRELRAATGITYDDLQRGILQIYTDRQGFDEAAQAAELVRRYGIAREVKTAAECVALEPALAARRDWIVGGTYTATDESGDAANSRRKLAALGAARGIAFRFGVTVESIAVADGAVRGVRMVNENERKEVVAADAYVVCLASHSPKVLDRIGVPTLVYPAKGYSATLPIANPALAPTISVTDDAKKIVFTRLGDRLRVAGTAELVGLQPGAQYGALRGVDAAGERVVWRRHRCGAPRVYWAGLRPATPSNVPLIGRTRYRNLYLNVGHGTLGWTMAAGSGKALAEIVGGKPRTHSRRSVTEATPAVRRQFDHGARQRMSVVVGLKAVEVIGVAPTYP